MTIGSFQYVGKNSVDDFGIYVRQYTPVVPQKRLRKVNIPYRHGAYNYGVKAYDEIAVTLDCFCEKDYERDDFREVSLWLSKAGNLTFWDEDDKFYKGEFESFPSYSEFTLLRMEPFQITFVAHPFIFGQRKVSDIFTGTNNPVYKGTAEQPAFLRLVNTSNQIINGVQISLVYKED